MSARYRSRVVATAVILAIVAVSCRTPQPERLQMDDIPPPGYVPVESTRTEAVPSVKDPQREAIRGAFVPGNTISHDKVASIIDGMTLRARIGQRFIGRIPPGANAAHLDRIIRTGLPGGFILYRYNYDSADEVIQLTELLNRLNAERNPGFRLFLTADQEGGRVDAFRFPNTVRFPGALYMGSYNDPLFVRSATYVNLVQIRELGLNMNLAPVLDLYGTPDRTIIGDRAYGEDPAVVAEFARSYLDAARDARVIPVAKHFPGHGITRVDSHGWLPIVEAPESEIRARHLVPFEAAVEHGLDAIMTAHILYTDIDADFPATLSDFFLIDLLRTEMGFDGVVMSDGIEMGAISRHYSVRETLYRAFLVGVDIILSIETDFTEMITIVEELVAEGLLTENQIDEGTARVLRLKHKYGLLDMDLLVPGENG